MLFDIVVCCFLNLEWRFGGRGRDGFTDHQCSVLNVDGVHRYPQHAVSLVLFSKSRSDPNPLSSQRSASASLPHQCMVVAKYGFVPCISSK